MHTSCSEFQSTELEGRIYDYEMYFERKSTYFIYELYWSCIYRLSKADICTAAVNFDYQTIYK